MCKSCATHRALITSVCVCVCHLVRRDSSAFKFDRVDIAFILALFYWLKPLTDEGGEETGVPGEIPWRRACNNFTLKVFICGEKIGEIWWQIVEMYHHIRQSPCLKTASHSPQALQALQKVGVQPLHLAAGTCQTSACSSSPLLLAASGKTPWAAGLVDTSHVTCVCARACMCVCICEEMCVWVFD